VKCIAISGAFAGGMLPVAMRLGADAVLAKPVSPDVLLKTLDDLLSAPSAIA
jgi:CheY-like chemotaxis protein